MTKTLDDRILLPEMDPKTVADEIGEFIVSRLKRVNAAGGVIGLSGGVDSTTAAALAKRAFDRYNAEGPEQQMELVGYVLPSETNNPDDTQDGVRIAEQLGIRYEVRNIEPIVDAYDTTNPKAVGVDYHKGNLMSRIRANLLSTKAATEKKTVIGTGNRDEDYGIGYYTLFGDGAVHMNPIGGLPKRLVFKMADYLGFPDIAAKVPTAGLEPGQTDFGDLGYSYATVELVTEGLAQGFEPDLLVDHPQIKAQVEPELKKSKYDHVYQVVDDVCKRHYNVAAAKAEIIHPPVAEVTLSYR